MFRPPFMAHPNIHLYTYIRVCVYNLIEFVKKMAIKSSLKKLMLCNQWTYNGINIYTYANACRAEIPKAEEHVALDIYRYQYISIYLYIYVHIYISILLKVLEVRRTLPRHQLLILNWQSFCLLSKFIDVNM